LDGLAAMVPEPRCELRFDDPFQLLIATQLSAQSTDAMVNKVTPALFSRWRGAAELARADLADVEAVVRPTGFFRVKAKNAVESARLLVERHGGQVPRTVEELTALPGVARKTANVVLGTAFGIASGITVDTHALRVTRRWGWHRLTDPVKVEQVLMKRVPRAEWIDFGHRVVLLGRYHCMARGPRCGSCALNSLCAEGRRAAGP
jgi:endonuclease-3